MKFITTQLDLVAGGDYKPLNRPIVITNDDLELIWDLCKVPGSCF